MLLIFKLFIIQNQIGFHDMEVTFQPDGGGKHKDFGDFPTIEIAAFNPNDIFKLGVMCEQMKELLFVASTTSDEKGMFIRLPLQVDKRLID